MKKKVNILFLFIIIFLNDCTEERVENRGEMDRRKEWG